MEFKKYGKTPRFRKVVKSVQHRADFKGLDSNGEPVYEKALKPIITFTGTVKLHGSNSFLCYDGEILKAGKRSSFISEKTPNAHFGFSDFAYNEHREYLENIMHVLHNSFSDRGETIYLYGEFAGKGIQKGAGISEFKKSFYFFALRVYNPSTEKSKWVDISHMFRNLDNPYIHNIYDFDTFNLDIDFNNPKKHLDALTKLTESVEKECPVSRQLGKPGAVGEGIVWTAYWEGQKLIFKTKGKKHSASKAKKKVDIAPEVLKSINDFVEYSVTENRVNQAIKETNADDVRSTGKVLKWISKDILEEESDVLESNGLKWEQVVKEINTKARELFFEVLKDF